MSTSTNTNPTLNPNANASLNPRIDEVKREVKKIKADVENSMELKNTLDDLKNTIIDIRALMSETQNPSNLLQFITDEGELNKMIQAKPLLEKKLAKDKAGEKTKNKVEGKDAAGAEANAAETVGKEVGFVVDSKDTTILEASENTVEKGDEIKGRKSRKKKEKTFHYFESPCDVIPLGEDEARLNR